MTDTTEKNHDENPTAIPLAIVGIGCLFPGANDPQRYWTNIRDGVDAITEIPPTHWNPDDYFDADKHAPDMTYARRGGFINPVDFDPLLYGMSPNNIEATDTTQLLGMVVARQALLDAGYATGRDTQDGRPFDRHRTSVILGVTGTLELVIPLGARLGHPIWRKALADAGVDPQTTEEVVERISAGYVPWQENSFPGLLGNVAAGRIANRFDLGGTNCVVDAACASSLSAIHLAALELYSGRSDMAITGGFDTFNDIFMYMCFSKTPALSPTGNSKPFDSNGDGTILGEGLGAIVLKRLADAERDGDKIYAVLRGIGSSSDGRGNAIYAPSANGQTRALKNAYRDAGVSPATIELVEAHGTGTKVGDAVEAEALSAVYREAQPEGSWCAIGSVKSMIGHTKAAAGVAGLIKVALALKHKVLPPTIKVKQPLDVLTPGKAPVYVNTNKRPWIGNRLHPRRGAISAFGFGGSNFHCVLEEAPKDSATIDWDGNVLLLAFSADQRQILLDQLNAIDVKQGWDALRITAAKSLKQFRHTHTCRLLCVLTPSTALDKLFNDIRQKLNKAEPEQWSLPDGAWFASGAPKGQLALLFPGQGSQYPDMLLDLACQFPQIQSTLAEADAVFAEMHAGERLGSLVYPIPVFNDEERKAQSGQLRATQHAQPAIGAVSLGALRILEHFGIQADATAGHSFGELTALCTAGRIDGDSLHRLANKRGELMNMGSGDHGSMLAVAASAAVVHEILEAEQLDLIIANNNAPRQVVLSGATDTIKRAFDVIGKRGLGVKILPVAAAFHSSHVSGAEKPFAKFMQTIRFHNGAIPVYANTTAKPYPDTESAVGQLLARQLAQPVEFVSQIENMYADGIRAFVEVGPGNVLTGLVSSILGEREHTVMALDASKGKKGGQYDLACLLARLAVLGHQIHIERWDELALQGNEPTADKKPAMTIKLTGANYIKPRPQPDIIRKDRTPMDQRSDSTPKATTTPQMAAPRVTPATPTIVTAGTDQASQLLQATQQSILALQQMQEQTAELHRRYLEGQQAAQLSIQRLIEQQQQLLTGTPVSFTPMPVMAPAQPAVIKPLALVIPTTPVAAPVAAAPAPLPVIEKSAPVAIRTSDTGLETLLLQVIAEKTGYPAEMLSLEMSLDTDLGIDSIKRVEILSGLQEKLPGMRKIQPEDLGTFRLLKHIIEYLTEDETVPTASPVVAAAPVARTIDPAMNQVLLAVVADKTGYPVDMLRLDMNLDTDLGIDSIKRVEILSAFQERMPDAPAVNPEHMASLQTLQQIVDYMQKDAQPAVAIASAPTTTATPATTGNNAASNPAFDQALLEVVADKTGYPVDMLRLDMNLDTDLGIDSIKRVEILSAFQERMPDAPAVNPEHMATLQTLQQIVDYMHGGRTQTATPAPQRTSSQPVETSANLWRGVIKLAELNSKGRNRLALTPNAPVLVAEDGDGLAAALCQELNAAGQMARVIPLNDRSISAIAGLVIVAPVSPKPDFILNAFTLIQHHAAGLKTGTTLLAAISRMGGDFGIGQFSGAALAGGLAGLVKTAAREWPDSHCRVLDISADTSANSIAEEVLLEGPVETGLCNKERIQLTLESSPLPNATAAPVSAGDVVVVSGGARGVTAAVAIEIAGSYHANLLLLGRTAISADEPAWLCDLNDEASIKRALLDNSSERLNPKQFETRYRELIAAREIRITLEKIRATGVKVLYQAVDVRNTADLGKVLAEARNTLGPVRGLVHGAGVLADRRIEDKTAEQFEQVWSTKVEGLNALLDATANDTLKFIVLFSSSTARYGRIGQIDYAAANEVLNKTAQQLHRTRPACRVVSVNWGPWDGGMVTPGLKKVFESEGVGIIPLKAGARYLINEIANPGPVEVVLLGSAPAAPQKPGRTSDKDTALHIAFDRNVSVTEMPVLGSHIMNGRAVLPTALIAEWLAHGAMHSHPGIAFNGFDRLAIYKGVILEHGAQLNVQIAVSTETEEASRLQVPVELRQGKVLHAGAHIVLGSELPTAPAASNPAIVGVYPSAGPDLYQGSGLFHGPDLHGIEAITGYSDRGISARVRTAPNPSVWMNQPIRTGWLADPLALDCAFQLMILWCFLTLGAGSLPTRIGSYRQYRRNFPKEGVIINLLVTASGKHEARANIEFVDLGGKLVARIEGYECVIDASLAEAFKRNRPEKESQL